MHHRHAGRSLGDIDRMLSHAQSALPVSVADREERPRTYAKANAAWSHIEAARRALQGMR